MRYVIAFLCLMAFPAAAQIVVPTDPCHTRQELTKKITGDFKESLHKWIESDGVLFEHYYHAASGRFTILGSYYRDDGENRACIVAFGQSPPKFLTLPISNDAVPYLRLLPVSKAALRALDIRESGG